MNRYCCSAAIVLLCLTAGCGPTIRVHNNSWGFRVVKEQTRKTDELLEVQVDVRNVSIMKLGFEYRFMWLDKGEFVLQADSRWKSATLDAGETMPIRATAPDPDARTVRFLLRQPETYGSFD